MHLALVYSTKCTRPQNPFHGLPSHAMGQIARCFYYFFMIVVIRYKTKATARRTLTFIVRISVNDTIAIAVWTCFHVCASKASRASPLAVQFVLIVAAIGNVDRGLEFRHGPFTSVWRYSITEDGKNRPCRVVVEPPASIEITKLSAE